jgi:TniQ
MAGIPIRLAPLPGEALDSWLGAYADLLHVTVRDIFTFAGVSWGRVNGRQDTGKPWLCQLNEPDLAALSAATGVTQETLAGMTLARYQGTGLAEVTAPPGMRRTPRWWRQLSGSRYCPRCLAANGGRWMLAWRIPWAFACTGCQVLLADTCPDCGRRHQRTHAAQPRQPGRCDLTGLPLPPWRPPRGGTVTCTSDPRGHAVRRPAGRRARAGRPAARRRPHRGAARIPGPASGNSRPSAAAGRHPRGRPRCRLSPDRDGRSPGRGHRGPGRTRGGARTRRCRQRARPPGGRAAPAARARHRVRRHHRRHHAAHPARRSRPAHRRLACRKYRQPPQHHQPGERPHPLGPGQPRPAGRPGQAAGSPAGHLLPAPLPRHRRSGTHPRPRPRPGARRGPAVADVARLGAAPDAARGLPTSCATGPRSRSCSPSR